MRKVTISIHKRLDDARFLQARLKAQEILYGTLQWTAQQKVPVDVASIPNPFEREAGPLHMFYDLSYVVGSTHRRIVRKAARMHANIFLDPNGMVSVSMQYYGAGGKQLFILESAVKLDGSIANEVNWSNYSDA